MTITSTPDGVVLRAKGNERVSTAHPPMLMKRIPDGGMMAVVQLSQALVKQLPRWQGTRVKGGELFVEDRGGQSMHFVLVTPRARATVLVDDRSHPEPVLAFLEQLEVGWAES